MHVPAVKPGREEFRDLARSYTVIPVWSELLADLTTPVSLFQRCVGNGEGFLLESVERAETWGRWSFIGRNPSVRLCLRDGELDLEGELPPGVPENEGILSAIEGLLEYHSTPEFKDFPPLHNGLVGYLGYDVVREIEQLSEGPSDDRGIPDAVMAVIGEIVAIDHWKQRAILVANVFLSEDSNADAVDKAYDDALRRLEQLAEDGATGLDEPIMEPAREIEELPDVFSTMGPESYGAAVEAAREYICAGDVFQVVLAQRFDFRLEAEPFDVYRVLRQSNPSPYMYFLRDRDVTVVGASPEPMVRLLDNQVISRPIAGTRRRGKTELEERRMAAELMEDPKELAEHVMLLDLARNDVGRVVSFGSEEVDEMMTLERYSHVMHLTSQVSGSLAEGCTPIDVLRATLPAGTVSGAPKVRAMQIIDELEPTRRGPYAGVVGYLDFSGNIDTAIAIRTMFVRDGVASVQAGAGIVVDSDPSLEHLECVNKARALLAAVPAARRMSERRVNP